MKAERVLYWEFPAYGSQQALREGDWILLRRGLKKGDLEPELYNLRDDIGQANNLAAEFPERVARMMDLMAAEHVPSKEFPLPGVDN